jgi:hypothetical protein
LIVCPKKAKWLSCLIPGNPAICSSVKRPAAFRPLATGLAFTGLLEKQTLQKKLSYIFEKLSLKVVKLLNYGMSSENKGD